MNGAGRKIDHGHSLMILTQLLNKKKCKLPIQNRIRVQIPDYEKIGESKAIGENPGSFGNG